MAGIKALLALVETQLRVGYPALTTAFDAREIDRHGEPPRIVWVVTGAAHAAPAKIAGRQKSLLTRRVQVVAHVWAGEVGALEELVDDAIVALHRVAHGCLDFDGEDWLATDDQDRGNVALLRFRVEVPVLERRFALTNRTDDQARTMARPTAIDADTTTSAQGDGALDWKEP